MNILTRFFHQNNVGSEKVIALSIVYNGYVRKIQRIEGQGRRILAFFTDLSEAFDCIGHNLLITKLSWYRVTPKSLKLFFSYLSNRTESVGIDNSYNRKSDMKYGATQGSVLAPILFNPF